MNSNIRISMMESKKSAAEQIKEILEKNCPKNTKNSFAIDYSISEAAELVKNGYVLFLKNFVPKQRYFQVRDIAKNIFMNISDKELEQ